ncbi:hypothetical protein G7046_g3700 [Stylonectria norvegica]|nr:hypothetical protein G7046_g3700 [Stylonectria norvegica]
MPPIMVPRSRLAPNNRVELRAREAEYQAIWQCCDRTSNKDEYKYSNKSDRKVMLRIATNALLEKRRRRGTQMCNTNVDEMIERHLLREDYHHARKRSGHLPANAPLRLGTLTTAAINEMAAVNEVEGTPAASPLAPVANMQANSQPVDEQGIKETMSRNMNDLISKIIAQSFEAAAPDGRDDHAHLAQNGTEAPAKLDAPSTTEEKIRLEHAKEMESRVAALEDNQWALFQKFSEVTQRQNMMGHWLANIQTMVGRMAHDLTWLIEQSPAAQTRENAPIQTAAQGANAPQEQEHRSRSL